MSFILLSWCEPNSPIRYPIRRQVRDRPTVGKKVYIQSDRLLCALCSSWHCFWVRLYTLFHTVCLRCQSNFFGKEIHRLCFFFLFNLFYSFVLWYLSRTRDKVDWQDFFDCANSFDRFATFSRVFVREFKSERSQGGEKNSRDVRNCGNIKFLFR